MTMRERQAIIIDELGVLPVINVELEIGLRKRFLKRILASTHRHGFVLGISGGQDSALAGKLAQEAVAEYRAESGEHVEFIALLLPYGVQADGEEARYVAEKFIKADRVIEFNIKDSVDAFEASYNSVEAGKLPDFHKGNVKARIRMTTQYAYSGVRELLVIGTDHAAEAAVGFYTVGGDGQADVVPLAGLNKRQGKALLASFDDVPEFLLTKKPTADLLDEKPQQADEAELGIDYEALDDYLEGRIVSDEVAYQIESRFIKTAHKRRMPISPLG